MIEEIGCLSDGETVILKAFFQSRRSVVPIRPFGSSLSITDKNKLTDYQAISELDICQSEIQRILFELSKDNEKVGDSKVVESIMFMVELLEKISSEFGLCISQSAFHTKMIEELHANHSKGDFAEWSPSVIEILNEISYHKAKLHKALIEAEHNLSAFARISVSEYTADIANYLAKLLYNLTVDENPIAENLEKRHVA